MLTSPACLASPLCSLQHGGTAADRPQAAPVQCGEGQVCTMPLPTHSHVPLVSSNLWLFLVCQLRNSHQARCGPHRRPAANQHNPGQGEPAPQERTWREDIGCKCNGCIGSSTMKLLLQRLTTILAVASAGRAAQCDHGAVQAH